MFNRWTDKDAAASTGYQAELRSERMVRALRSGVVVVATLNPCFILLDGWVHPDRFWLLLTIRTVWEVVMAGVYWLAGRLEPLTATRIGCLAAGFGLIAVIGAAGAETGSYAPGLMLLFLGMPVLLPLSAKQAIEISGVLLGFHCVTPLLFGDVEWRPYLLYIFFPTAAALECIASCTLLDRMRFADFLQRRELEKARDELKELDVAKSRFTANIHHELRTPLTLTLAPTEAMLAGEFGEVSELQRGYLKTIHSNALRLLKLINNLLDLAKIESEQLSVTRRPTRVVDVIGDVVAGARPLAERKGVALEMRGLEELPQVNLDPDALEKVIVNLLGNALKFTDAGGRIEVSGRAGQQEGIHLVVSDTGIGIPEDQLGRIFDRFAQVDGSSTRKHEGTGIGLALVQELVGLHEGRIWAESEGPGRGTRIHVTLPAGSVDAEAEEAVLEESEAGHSKQSAVLGNSLAAMGAELEVEDAGDEERFGDGLRLAELERNVERAEGAAARTESGVFVEDGSVSRDAPEVLIVEDNPDMRRLLSFLIGQEFRLRVARNGREGLEKARERLPDLVLTDVMMPEMSGTELCAALKGEPRSAGVPVVLVTSKAEREMKISGLELGADDYVTKPFHPRELLARVRSLVRLRRLQAELAVRNALLESTNEELRSTMEELQEAGARLVQAERLAAVGELAAGVAHEVNNPVNFALNAAKTLSAYVEDIREVAGLVSTIDPSRGESLAAQIRELEELRERLRFDESAEALAELVKIVSEGLERTSRLVSELRDFAAPGDQRRADVDIERGLRSTIQLVRHGYDQARVELEVEIAENLPRIEGDARALNQVFLNLLKNASDAFEGAGGKVHVSAREEEGDAVVEVRDDGMGIAPEIQGEIFNPFFTTKAAGRGSGLGLSMSRRIVDDHGGRIEVESEPGSGTTMRVRLPGSLSSERASETAQ